MTPTFRGAQGLPRVAGLLLVVLQIDSQTAIITGLAE
jgi:hypothetical protein